MPGRRVALEEHLVAAARVVLAPEEVVEAHLVQAGRATRTSRGGRRCPGTGCSPRRTIATAFQRTSRRIRRSSSSSPGKNGSCSGLIVLMYRVLGEARQPDVPLARALQQLEHQESGPVLALLVHDLVERVEPVLGLGLVDVGQLVLELVEVHQGSVDAGDARRESAYSVAPLRPGCAAAGGFDWDAAAIAAPIRDAPARRPPTSAGSRFALVGHTGRRRGPDHDYAAARPRRG